jgi:hypothetical protein
MQTSVTLYDPKGSRPAVAYDVSHVRVYIVQIVHLYSVYAVCALEITVSLFNQA